MKCKKMENLLRVLVVQREAVEQKLSRARCALEHCDERPGSNIRGRCFLQVYLDNVKRCGEEYQHIQSQIYALPLSDNQRFEQTEAHFKFGSLYDDTAKTLSMLMEYALRAAEEQSKQEAVASPAEATLDPEPVDQPNSDEPSEEWTIPTKSRVPESLDGDDRSDEEIGKGPSTKHPVTKSEKEKAVARNHQPVMKNEKNKKIKLKKRKQCEKHENKSESEKNLEFSDACFDTLTDDREKTDWQDCSWDLSSDIPTIPLVAEAMPVHESGIILMTGTPAGTTETPSAVAACNAKPSLHLTAVGSADGLCDTLPLVRVLQKSENLLTRRMVNAIDADNRVGETNDSNAGCCRMPNLTMRSNCEGCGAAMERSVAARITGGRPMEVSDALTGYVLREKTTAALAKDSRERVDLLISADYVWILHDVPLEIGTNRLVMENAKLGRIVKGAIAHDGPVVAQRLCPTVDVESFIVRLNGFYKNESCDRSHPILKVDEEEHDRHTHGQREQGNLLQRLRFWTTLTYDGNWTRLTQNDLKVSGDGRLAWNSGSCTSMLLADYDDQHDGTDPEERVYETLAIFGTVATQKLKGFVEFEIDPGPFVERSWKGDHQIRITVLDSVQMLPGSYLPKRNERDKVAEVVLLIFQGESEHLFANIGRWRLILSDVGGREASHRITDLVYTVHIEKKTTVLTQWLVRYTVLWLISSAQTDDADTKHRFNKTEAFLDTDHGTWRVTTYRHEPTVDESGILFDETTCATLAHAGAESSSRYGQSRADGEAENLYTSRTRRLRTSKINEKRQYASPTSCDGAAASATNKEQFQRAKTDDSKLQLNLMY